MVLVLVVRLLSRGDVSLGNRVDRGRRRIALRRLLVTRFLLRLALLNESSQRDAKHVETHHRSRQEAQSNGIRRRRYDRADDRDQNDRDSPVFLKPVGLHDTHGRKEHYDEWEFEHHAEDQQQPHEERQVVFQQEFGVVDSELLVEADQHLECPGRHPIAEGHAAKEEADRRWEQRHDPLALVFLKCRLDEHPRLEQPPGRSQNQSGHARDLHRDDQASGDIEDLEVDHHAGHLGGLLDGGLGDKHHVVFDHPADDRAHCYVGSATDKPLPQLLKMLDECGFASVALVHGVSNQKKASTGYRWRQQS